MDDMGYQTEPYAFYFNEGENELTIRAINEPVILCAVRMTPLAQFPSYEEYIAGQPEVTMSEEALNYSQTIQGESSLLRSAPSLYPRYDRSSALTEPYSVSNTILNYIGGDAWTNPGDWIEWSFSVPEDGYYNLSIKARQIPIFRLLPASPSSLPSYALWHVRPSWQMSGWSKPRIEYGKQ